MSKIRISTDKTELDVERIYQFLSQSSYWAKERTKEELLCSIQNSMCFGAFRGVDQIGFARIVTDTVVFGWVMDFFVLESEQKKGVGQLLMDTILKTPEIKNVTSVALRTRDAHRFYNKFDFEEIPEPNTWMLKRKK